MKQASYIFFHKAQSTRVAYLHAPTHSENTVRRAKKKDWWVAVKVMLFPDCAPPGPASRQLERATRPANQGTKAFTAAPFIPTPRSLGNVLVDTWVATWEPRSDRAPSS